MQKKLIEEQKLKVDEALEELNQQNEEITIQHNLLYEQNLAITDAHQKLQIREQELAKSNATKDKFFSIISHDLRSPFNILLNLSKFSLELFEETDPAEIKENISSINIVANLTYNLLENLLQWATIQTGKSESHFEKINVNGLIDDVFDLMHNVAIYKKISLIKNFGDDQVLFVDQEMIKTVIRNLLSNAIKFTRQEVL